jgi:hypothetical protein
MDIIHPFNIFFLLQIGRLIMERSRPLNKIKSQFKHSIINKQEQLIRLLEN